MQNLSIHCCWLHEIQGIQELIQMHQEMITFIEMFVGSVELWKHCPKHIHGSSGIIVVIVVKSMWGEERQWQSWKDGRFCITSTYSTIFQSPP